MFQRIYIVFLIINIWYNKKTSCFQSFYGVRTNEYPKTSCHKIANIKTVRRCVGTCRSTTDSIAMISHDKSTKVCMCCSDITGSVITGPNWKTFVAMHCANGYVSYDLMSHQICLKYFPVPVTYESARTLCQADGADLIKIDSQKKFDIFKDYHVPIASTTPIQVWIQSKKVNGQWQFHDGSPMPTLCQINMSGNPDEDKLRACVQDSTALYYQDAPNYDIYHYSCEYKR